MMGVEDGKMSSSGSGFSPVYPEPNLAVVSIGFLLESKEKAVIWRGARKSALIQEFITKVDWNKLDFLIVDGESPFC